MNSPISLFIFDFNGVLVNDIPYHVKAYKKALEEAGAHYTGDEIYPRIGSKTDELIKKALKDKGVDTDYRKITKRKVELLKKYTKGKNLLFPNTEKALKRLLKNNKKLALLTSSIKEQIPDYFNLDFFEVAITASDDFKGKPDPEAIFHILEQTNTKKENSAYIGDFVKDMKTAKRPKLCP